MKRLKKLGFIIATIPVAVLVIDALLVGLYILAFFAMVGHGGGPPLYDWFAAEGYLQQPYATILGLLVIFGLIGAAELPFFFAWEQRQVKKDREKKRGGAQKNRAPFNYWS